jgi:Na+/proline symporter
MPIGVLFWVLMVFAFIFGLYVNRADIQGGNYGLAGHNLLLFILREVSPMPIGVLFWVLMVLWFLFGLYWGREDISAGKYGMLGGNLLLFILLALIGWKVFGPVLQ